MSIKKDCVVIIPIYHPDDKFNQLLHKLREQKNVSFDVYIVDSGSDRNTYQDELKELSYKIVKTTPQEFNHGGTRRKAAEACSEYPYLVYMTQDAVPVNENSLEHLLAVFQKDKRVGCAYGRQLPNPDASILSAHARLFNYPPKSRIKQFSDAKELGIKTAFVSDTFAAYRQSALNEVGNFPHHVILGEDTHVAAKMVLSGWKSAYCADAEVYHSHNYTIMQEFRRYFDTGVFHTEEPWIRKSFGAAEGEGRRFVLSEMQYVLSHKPWLIVSMIVRDGMKFLGYRMGISYRSLPQKIIKKVSMTKSYWG